MVRQVVDGRNSLNYIMYGPYAFTLNDFGKIKFKKGKTFIKGESITFVVSKK